MGGGNHLFPGETGFRKGSRIVMGGGGKTGHKKVKGDKRGGTTKDRLKRKKSRVKV